MVKKVLNFSFEITICKISDINAKKCKLGLITLRFDSLSPRKFS